MSTAQTNPQSAEVNKPQLSMFDVMFGSDESTNPEQTIEEPVELEEYEFGSELEAEADDAEEYVEDDGDYEVDEEEEQPETPRYYVKVDGEEQEVTLDELRNGYQRQADYTRKSQALAEQRKAYEANLQAIQSEREQYSQALEMMAAQQKNELSQYENIDWKALKEDDPMEYMEKRLEYQDARDQLARVQQEQQRVSEQRRLQVLEQTQKVMENEAKKLSEVLPAYADPSSNLKTELRDYALSLGFSQDDLNSIVDHRVVVVLHKAMLQDRAAQGTVRKAKASKPVPKVVKSGTPESKTQRSKKASQQRRERLAKTGSTRDATSVFLDLIS
jgi:hypothetical protein